MYPSDPRACSELKSAADDINVEGRVERYPSVPKPWSELTRAAEEMKLEGTDDR
jgi:hypothetical protein